MLRLPRSVQIMKYFSLLQRLQLLLDGENELLFVTIFHVIECCTLLSFNVQTYWLRAVAFLLSLFLNELLWALNLVLNGVSVNPTYVSCLWSSWQVTVAWYTIPCVKHFPSSGQFVFLLQLHPGGSFLASFFITVLLWALMIWLMLGIVR